MLAYYTSITHTSPTVITLEQAKKQLKMEDLGEFDDDIIQDCIDAAIDEAENYCNTAFRQAKYRVQMGAWKNDFVFKFQKVATVDQITYKDADGNDQTLPTESYQILACDNYESVLHFKTANSLPALQPDNTTAVSVDITIGYAAGEVPKAVQQAIKLLITDNYEYRGDREKPLNTASRVKLEPYKYYTIPNG